MWLLAGIAITIFSIVSLILPWVNRSRIQELDLEIVKLRSRLNVLSASLDTEKELELRTPHAESAPSITLTTGITPEIPITLPEPEKPKAVRISVASPVQTGRTAARTISLEQQFGTRLPVWIGGIALAFAGFFLVKYSIDTGLLTESVRVILGLIFGMGLLCAGDVVRMRPGFANGARISQALSGAGIADLYVSLFAATSLYHLVPPFIGFLGMALVTAAAVVLSLRHGPPIAVLGLIGGFLTPALVGSNEPSAPLLFTYLYIVFTALMIVIKRQNWWVLSIPMLIGAFLWVGFWLVAHFTPADSLWLILFLGAVTATIATNTRHHLNAGTTDPEIFSLTSMLNYAGLGGALVLVGVIAFKSSFGLMEWGLFGLVAMGGLALAYFNEKFYSFVPWVSMAVAMVMLYFWHPSEPWELAGVILASAVLFTASGYLFLWHSETPLLWAGLSAAAALGFYLLGYTKLHTILFMDIPLFWGLLAFAQAALAVYAMHQIWNEIPERAEREWLLAVFATTATAFISLALTIELEREFLSVAFAAEVLAIAWINRHVSIQALRPIAAILAAIFGALLLPQIMLLIQLTVYSLIEAKLYIQHSIPIVNWPLFQLGLPALMFAGAGLLLRKERDDSIVKLFEAAAVALIAVMGYYLTRHAFHAEENVLFVKAGFLERGVITNILFLYGLACLVVGRRFVRETLVWSGMILSAIALFRIAYFDLFIHNPLWAHQNVGGAPIVNALLITYGLPIAWTIAAARMLPSAALKTYAQGAALVLLFALISFNVRQLFHGAFLHAGQATNAEIYTYSIVWLLFGIGLLAGGIITRDRMTRLASLGVIVLVVGKVFLFDASELTGLYRVFSFFGLGLSLLGLSYFYTRFVFGRENALR